MGINHIYRGIQPELENILDDVKLPRFYKVRQKFDKAHIPRQEIYQAVKVRMAECLDDGRVKQGMRIALTAGSRGIANIDLILKAAADYLREKKAEPFIVPAMGSHGGATAEGQKKILEGYGIKEEAMGCPVLSSMEVASIGRTVDGRQVFIDKAASEAGGIIVIGRIKPHTAFRGAYQSGLMKMMAVGLGKQYGASVCHGEGFRRMAYNVEVFGRAVLERSPVLCGVGVIENAFDETFDIAVLNKEEIMREEPKLLKRAEELMPRIMLPECDVLIVDEIGKNFSGDGMDPNVTGTFSTPYAKGGIRAERVCVLDLSPESYGNGMGAGMASVITERLCAQLDLNAMYLNGLTCKNLNGSRIPCVLPSDRRAIQFCLKTCVKADSIYPKVVRIFNSQFLEYLWVSEALADKLPDGAEILGPAEHFVFDEEGNLTDKEPRQRGFRRFD